MIYHESTQKMYQIYWIYDNYIKASKVLDWKPPFVLLNKILEANNHEFSWHLACLR